MPQESEGEPRLELAHRLYFLRHGETEWNRERRLQGVTDIPLNDTGRAQALRHADVMAGLGEDWSAFDFAVSPMSRARETFDIIRERLALTVEPEFDDRLAEGSFGRWEGWTWNEVAAREPDEHATWVSECWSVAPHGGETYGGIARRFADWAASMTRPTVVVSHGGVSRALRAIYLGLGRDELAELAALPVPQDRFMRLENGEVEWL